MGCRLPGSSVHGILQAKILECVAILFSRGSSQPKDWTQVSHIAGGFFTSWATGAAQGPQNWDPTDAATHPEAIAEELGEYKKQPSATP